MDEVDRLNREYERVVDAHLRYHTAGTQLRFVGNVLLVRPKPRVKPKYFIEGKEVEWVEGAGYKDVCLEKTTKSIHVFLRRFAKRVLQKLRDAPRTRHARYE